MSLQAIAPVRHRFTVQQQENSSPHHINATEETGIPKLFSFPACLVSQLKARLINVP
jgi:hypothetical protein